MTAISLLLDQGIPHDAARLLRDAGIACLHASEIGMSKSDDDQILAHADKIGAFVVTLDADFHAMLAVSGVGGPSVIPIRLQGLAAPPVSELVTEVPAAFGDELLRGSLVTIKSNKTTCRHLPVRIFDQ